jgi:hypothetical protein
MWILRISTELVTCCSICLLVGQILKQIIILSYPNYLFKMIELDGRLCEFQVFLKVIREIYFTYKPGSYFDELALVIYRSCFFQSCTYI